MPLSSAVVIGLDAGTTSAKMVAVNAEGVIQASADSDPIPTQVPSLGASVQQPSAIWNALATACRRGMSTLDRSTPVAALALAAQSGSVIPVERLDGEGNAGLITWMDTRSRDLVRSWDSSTQTTIRALSGWTPSPGLGLSTISWVRSGATIEPHRWASVDDFLIHELTGSWITNPSNAAGMQLMDVSSLEWSAELCGIAGVEMSTLSVLSPSGEQAGHLTASAAEATQLAQATPVVIGGHDQSCAALGLGVTTPGSALLSLGTAWVFTIITGQADAATVPHGFNLSPHVVPGRWSVSKNLGGLGAALASEITDKQADLDTELDRPSPSIDDPYFLPALHDAERTRWGRFAGPETTDRTKRLRAMIEACAFETRLTLEQASPSIPVNELTVIGGGTNSRYLTQQIADTAGVPLTVRHEASQPALGAAMLAARARDWPTFNDTATLTTTILPSRQYNDTMDRRYAEYRRLTSGDGR